MGHMARPFSWWPLIFAPWPLGHMHGLVSAWMCPIVQS